MNDSYIAHITFNDDGTERIQSVTDHNNNVAELAKSNAPIQELTILAWLCGILHDAGKFSNDFLEYIRRSAAGEPVVKGEVNHSSAGGQIINQLMPQTNLSQMVQMAVYSHHGLNDSVSFNNRTIFIEGRLKKEANTDEIIDTYFRFNNKELILEKCGEAQEEVTGIIGKILSFINSCRDIDKKDFYGNRDFYLGMYERSLMSLLIDADRTDTACFMHGRELPVQRTDEQLQDIWESCISHFEAHLKGIEEKAKGTSRLNQYRSKISNTCRNAGDESESLYRLSVPTGGGKTLSSLRFALYHAKKHHKKHIIYVAPYQSILDQNADEIRKVLDNPDDILLVHHSNVVIEGEEARKRYELLAENWTSSPVVVTTAVQFLNTLFAGKNSNIRRMYNLLNSVIIIDEVQSIPIRMLKMFNLATNFLTTFGNSTAVLCSATQPLFDELDKDRMLQPLNMVPEARKYAAAFKRTSVIDDTGRTTHGFTIPEMGDYIWEKYQKFHQVLVIVNTKKCAENLYKELKEKSERDGCMLHHLSTNMCPENRKEVLAKMIMSLEDNQKVICISTQIIEAGVDISFGCVIRSLTGLDSIIQSAGRCNRNALMSLGYVFIVQMCMEAEHIKRLEDICKAQNAMQQVLYQFKLNPEKFDSDLTSDSAIRLYYQIYLKNRLGEMEYSKTINGLDVTLLELLSANNTIWDVLDEEKKRSKSKYILKQSFKTAGDLFEAIPEDGKIDVIVRYNEEVNRQIDILEDKYASFEKQKKAIRSLQPYTVGISEQMRQNLGNALEVVGGGVILALSGDYYSRETGVSEDPVGMGFMGY